MLQAVHVYAFLKGAEQLFILAKKLQHEIFVLWRSDMMMRDFRLISFTYLNKIEEINLLTFKTMF